MNKNRMQKLAGINEGTAFKNGKFKLDRWEVGQYNYHGARDPYGKWCEAKDVAELEAIASEMYDILRQSELSVRLHDKYKNILKKISSL